MATNALSKNITTKKEDAWQLVDLGLLDYKITWDLQKKLRSLRAQDTITSNILILVEHPHVITVGKHGNPQNVLTNELPVYFIERGGDATYHGPGQLVGYLIAKMTKQYKSIREHVTSIGFILEKTLNFYRIIAKWKEKPAGVWVNNKKIASIGIAIKEWVTFHGFALNVNTDLSYFFKINPCGMHPTVMTSMEQILGKKIPMNEVKEAFVKSFEEYHHIKWTQNKNVESIIKTFVKKREKNE